MLEYDERDLLMMTFQPCRDESPQSTTQQTVKMFTGAKTTGTNGKTLAGMVA
jgi:hypothetical protein